MAAVVSGSVLSSLFFGQSNCVGDQEGLLFGQVKKHVKDTISDSQINNYEVHTKIYIYSCHDCTGIESFHDGRCQIKENTLQDIKTENSEIVGWYHFRRNTSPRISMKETCLHKKLLKSLPADTQENFLFFHCTVTQSGNMATHNFDYNLYKWTERKNKFSKVPITVVNLGDTTHTSYKHDKSCTVSPACGSFSEIMSKYQSELIDASGKSKEIQSISSLSHTLHTKLQDLNLLVAQSEQMLRAVEDDVSDRKNALKLKLDEKKRNQPLPPSPPPPAYEDVTRVEQNQKHKVTTEDAISIAKSKREQRRREGTKSLYPNLTTSLHTGRSATSKSRHEQMTHHSRRLSANMDTVETMDLDELGSSSETKMADIVGSHSNSVHTADDMLDTIYDLDSNLVKSDILEPKSSSTDVESDSTSSQDDTLTDRKSKEKLQENKRKNSDPFAFVADLMKDGKTTFDKNDYSRGSKVDSMTLHSGVTVKLPNVNRATEQTEGGSVNDFEEEIPQRKTRSQRAQKTQNERGSQRSQVKSVQGQRSRSKENSSRLDTDGHTYDSDKEVLKPSVMSNSKKTCHQQVTVECAQGHTNNTNSMHGTEEFIGDIEMANVTDSEFEISSSPVF